MECAEHETALSDREQMHGALAALGYEPTVRIVKERRTGRRETMGVCVDIVEVAGGFLEPELVVDDDRDGVQAQSEPSARAHRLGVELERTSRTHDTLVRPPSP